MARELEHISTITTVGDLPQKMEEAEESKVDVESKILTRVINKRMGGTPSNLTF